DDGIVFAQGQMLHIEQCVVANMSGRGILLQPSIGGAHVVDSTIRENGGAGIWVEGITSAVIARSRIERNVNTGIRVLNGPTVTITGSVVTGNAGSAGLDIDSNDGSDI